MKIRHISLFRDIFTRHEMACNLQKNFRQSEKLRLPNQLSVCDLVRTISERREPECLDLVVYLRDGEPIHAVKDKLI